MMPLALPMMVGLSAEQLLAGTLLTAGFAAGLAKTGLQFRRQGAEALATGLENATTLKEKIADMIEGAKLPVGFPPPWSWNPIGASVLVSKTAIEIAWEALNKPLLPATGVAGDWTFANNTNKTIAVSFLTIGVYNWPPGRDTWTALIGKQSEVLPANPWISGWNFYSSQILLLPPGASGVSLKHHMTGNITPNSRDDYWAATVAGVTLTSSIFGYNPGYFLGAAALLLPDEDVSVSENGVIEAKPNTLAPQGFSEPETPKRIAPPLPYLPASVPDIGTPVTPGPARTPSDPTKKEDPKAPPDLTPAKVPIWAPGPNPSRAPSPAGTPQPGRNPQTIPSSDPARPNVAFDVAGLPIPQVAPAVKPTSTTAHQVGSFTIPAKAPQPTLQGIAEEVGRIEQKLELVLTLGNKSGDTDWMEKFREALNYLFSIGGGGDYELSSPCELDANGQRIVKKAHYNGSLFPLGIMENKIDALAELMQHAKDLKQPNCNPPKVAPSTVTVTAYEVPPYS